MQQEPELEELSSWDRQQLWQKAQPGGISFPSSNSAQADQLEREPLPARACGCRPSESGGLSLPLALWPPYSMAVQSTLLAVSFFPAPILPTHTHTPSFLCLLAKNLLVVTKPRQENATSIVSSQQSTFLSPGQSSSHCWSLW